MDGWMDGVRTSIKEEKKGRKGHKEEKRRKKEEKEIGSETTCKGAFVKYVKMIST